eukprot:6138960-Lingulodinium_polyedra.AAC.1
MGKALHERGRERPLKPPAKLFDVAQDLTGDKKGISQRPQRALARTPLMCSSTAKTWALRNHRRAQ